MDSATSPHHESSDDREHRTDRHDHDDVTERLDHLADAIGDERATGSALFLSASARPPRATMEIPPDQPRKNGKTAGQDQEGPNSDE